MLLYFLCVLLFCWTSPTCPEEPEGLSPSLKVNSWGVDVEYPPSMEDLSRYYEGDNWRPCSKGNDKECPEGSYVDIELTEEEQRGWEIRVVGQSGEKQCRQKVKIPCPQNYKTKSEMRVTPCGRGYGPENTDKLFKFFSGDEECFRCIESYACEFPVKSGGECPVGASKMQCKRVVEERECTEPSDEEEDGENETEENCVTYTSVQYDRKYSLYNYDKETNKFSISKHAECLEGWTEISQDEFAYGTEMAVDCCIKNECEEPQDSTHVVEKLHVNITNERIEYIARKGYGFEVLYPSGPDHLCVLFYPIRCPPNFNNTQCEEECNVTMGYAISVAGYSDGKECILCVGEPCRPDNYSIEFQEVADCSTVKNPSGFIITHEFEGKEVWSEGKKCGLCSCKECPGNSYPLTPEKMEELETACTPEMGRQIVRNNNYSCDCVCGECECMKCTGNHTTDPNFDCGEGRALISYGKSCDDVCYRCMDVICYPPEVFIDVLETRNCSEEDGWYIKPNETYKECGLCKPKDCPAGTNINMVCKEGWTSRVLEKNGEVVKSGGETCYECIPKDCPIFCEGKNCTNGRRPHNGLSYKDENTKGDERRFNEIWNDCTFEEGREKVFAGYAGDDSCFACFPLECTEGYSVENGDYKRKIDGVVVSGRIDPPPGTKVVPMVLPSGKEQKSDGQVCYKLIKRSCKEVDPEGSFERWDRYLRYPEDYSPDNILKYNFAVRLLDDTYPCVLRCSPCDEDLPAPYSVNESPGEIEEKKIKVCDNDPFDKKNRKKAYYWIGLTDLLKNLFEELDSINETIKDLNTKLEEVKTREVSLDDFEAREKQVEDIGILTGQIKEKEKERKKIEDDYAEYPSFLDLGKCFKTTHYDGRGCHYDGFGKFPDRPPQEKCDCGFDFQCGWEYKFQKSRRSKAYQEECTRCEIQHCCQPGDEKRNVINAIPREVCVQGSGTPKEISSKKIKRHSGEDECVECFMNN